MFSYLRPHKRNGSTPSSPAEQSHSFEPPLRASDHGHPERWQDALSPDSATTASPPLLPPIQRVSSTEHEPGFVTESLSRPRTHDRDIRIANEREQFRTQNWDTSSRGNIRPKDTYTYSNHQRIPLAGQQQRRPESAGNVVPSSSSYTSTLPGRPSNGTTFDSILGQISPESSSQNFISSMDLQERGRERERERETGRRPMGVRLPTPPPTVTSPVSTFEPVKSGKTRLNLLNPMSLLARRRTSQAVPQLSPEGLVGNGGSNTTFDPRVSIKGKFHDFDKPARSRRNVSYGDGRGVEEGSNTGTKQNIRSPNAQHGESDHDANSPWSGGNHTPVFTENFEEEQYPAAGPHVRKASDLTDLPLPAPPYAHGASRSIEPPSSSKGTEPSQRDASPPPPRKASARKPVPVAPERAPPPVPPKPDAPVLQKRISIDPSATPPPKSNSSKKGRPRNVSDASVKDAVPRHMKSTSSRFSFDMIGAAEQERLLEDRHRQRALEKKADDPPDDGGGDEFDDDFDYDNMMDDDGLEERIPGVNADLEDDMDDYEEPIPGINADVEEEEEEQLEEDVPVSHDHLGGFSFQQTLITPLSPQSPAMVETPRDADGNVIGFAMTKNSPYLPGALHQNTTISPVSPASDDMPTSKPDEQAQGLGLHGVEIQEKEPSPNAEPPSDFPQASGIDDDDLYFDDGIITGPVDESDATQFDESVFDNIDTDEYGRPLKQLSTLPTLYPPPMIAPDPSPPLQKIDEDSESKTTTEIVSPTFPPQGGLAPKPSVSENLRPQPSTSSVPTHGLTENSLAAYQSALAAAAFTAAANGKFRRDSNTTASEIEDLPHPGLTADSSHNSHYEPFSPTYELEDDFAYNDDALADDAIIAAANAEALANDCDGFYGQEFGFYSAPAASAEEVEYANGGYFGPRGVEGINRSTSGRVNREPNLTPITERSEYSNRNSFMSLSMHGPGSGSISSPTPGLAQLAEMMSMNSPEFEAAGGMGSGDMSLNALLKLRRGAWGGSQASLHSSNGGSPRSAHGGEEMSPIGQGQQQQAGPWAPPGAGAAHRRKNSAFSEGAQSVVSEIESSPPSPTLTMSVPLPVQPVPMPVQESKEGGGANARDTRDAGGFKRGHKHSGSTESISYRKEEDPVIGESRWILERRRTGEDGGVEVLGREVVKGGRI